MRCGQLIELKPLGSFLSRLEMPYSETLFYAARVRPTAIDRCGEGPGIKTAARCLRLAIWSRAFRSTVANQSSARLTVYPTRCAKPKTLALVGESGSGKSTVGQWQGDLAQKRLEKVAR